MQNNKGRIIYNKDVGIIKKELMVIGYNCQFALTHLGILVPRIIEKSSDIIFYDNI